MPKNPPVIVDDPFVVEEDVSTRRPEDDADYQEFLRNRPAVKSEPDTELVETGRSVAPTTTVTQDLPEVDKDKESVPQSYVWLADGSVLRVNDSDLPGSSGAANPHGHWQRDKNVYEIVGIYPVESVKES